MKDYKNNRVDDEPCWQVKLVEAALFFAALTSSLLMILFLSEL